MFMTCKYPHHTGHYDNPVAPEVPFWKDPRHLPLLKMMKEAGFATSIVGKIHSGDVSVVVSSGAVDSMITWYWPGHDGPRQNLGRLRGRTWTASPRKSAPACRPEFGAATVFA